MIKSVCIYGVGGVGGYLGALMAEGNPGIDLSFIARGGHLEAIKRQGLTLVTDKGEINVRPERATDDVGEVPPADLYLICVKGYDLANAVRSIAGKLDEHSVILPTLNGIDIYDRIREVTPEGIVLPACIYVGTHIAEPGVIRQSGGDAKLIFGDDPEKPGRGGKEAQALFDACGLKYQYESNPYPAIWTKYMFIAGYGLVTAVTGKTLGEVYADERLRGDVRGIMEEIHALAAAVRIPLEDGIVETSLNKAKAFPFEAKTSFQRDVENPGKPNEKELLGGAIIRLGRSHGIKTPVTERYYGNIR